MSDIPKLLPLEYCTIERAAKMLRCEIEDIQHWIEIRAIDAYAIFDGSRGYRSLLTILPEMKLANEHVKLPYNLHYSGKAEKTHFNDETVENLPFSFSAVFNGDHELYGYPVGFWKLTTTKSYTHEIRNIYVFQQHNVNVTPTGCYDFFSGNPVNLVLTHEELPDLYILRNDLLSLHESIYSNKPLSTVFNNSKKAEEQEKNRQQEKSIKTHHKTQNAEQVRAEIIDFASDIFLADKKSTDPQITSAAKWANEIDEQAFKKWDDGQPPLSRARMERTLAPVYKAIIKCT